MRIILQTKFFAFMIFRVTGDARKKFWNGLLWLSLLGLPAVLSLGSCVKANIVFGQNQINDGLTNIVRVDSITPVMSTLFVDSLPSSGKGVAFIGGYNDPYFGPVNPRSYFQFSAPPLTTIDPAAVFDSLVLYVVPNKYYYGDTTSWVDIYASQVKTQMQYPVTQYQFYSNDSFPVDPTPLGHVHVQLRPNFPDTVYIPLDSNLGKDMFNRVRESSPSMTNANEFLNYFPGIQLSGGQGKDAQVLYGIKDTVMIKLWYHTPDGQRSISAMKFGYNNKAYQFNEMRTTPQGALSEFKHQYTATVQQIYSTDAGFNHMAYLDPLLGYTTKIEFPYVRQMLQADTNFRSVLKAQLIIHPVFPSFNTQFMLPSQLQLFTTDYTNQQGTPIASGLMTLDYGGYDTQYTFDVTSFITAELNDPSAVYYKRGLILAPSASNYYNTFNRLVLGDRSFQSPATSPNYYQTQLVLYYVSVINTL